MSDKKDIKNRDFDPGKKKDPDVHRNAYGTREELLKPRDMTQEIPDEPGKADKDAK